MDEIKVDKAKLLEVLKKNREAHRAIFEEALEGWKAEAIRQIEKLAEQARKGKLKNAYLSLPRPEDHTPDYDRHILMLEMDIDETVVLSEQEFSQFVQDDWNWKRQWSISNAGYSATLASMNSN